MSVEAISYRNRTYLQPQQLDWLILLRPQWVDNSLPGRFSATYFGPRATPKSKNQGTADSCAAKHLHRPPLECRYRTRHSFIARRTNQPLKPLPSPANLIISGAGAHASP